MHYYSGICYNENMKNIESLSSPNDAAESAIPYPFDINLQDFYDQAELKSVTAGKSAEEVATITEANHQALLHNNEEIAKFSDHVLQLSELDPAELDSLYYDEQTSDSDKSIIFCINTIRSAYQQGFYSEDEERLFYDIKDATESIYGFEVVEAREVLQNKNSQFKLLTEKERESVATGSLEDIASAALEAFVMNPNYHVSRIADYDEYLGGIKLDCTKRSVAKENGNETIHEEIDLEEFQDRVIESMSWAVLDIESVNQEYTESELAELQDRASVMYADHLTGHHYRTDDEHFNGVVKVSGSDNPASIYNFNYEDKNEAFWKVFNKRVKSNNDETFKYSRELARADMKPWADKIDIAKIEDINNNEELTCERKFEIITAYVQEALEVRNLDENEQSQPIKVNWFRFQDSKTVKFIKKIFNIPTKNEELPEKYAGGYYDNSEKAIYYLKPSADKKKLSAFNVDTIVHEMWHAKQYELAAQNSSEHIASTYDPKARMYNKNISSYNGLKRTLLPSGNDSYYMQILEREAYAIGNEIQSRLMRKQQKHLGEKVMKIIFW